MHQNLYDFYSLRWQVELIFKIWKSFFRIHHCNSVKFERLECQLAYHQHFNENIR
nr:transposase [Bacillus thuringiensis]